MSTVALLTYNDYKDYVRDWVASQPKRGYGQYRRMAEHLGTSTVFISQVFQGDRELQPEQAPLLSKFFRHFELEERYFLNLVYLARAASKELQSYHRQQLKDLRAQGQSLKNLIKTDIELSNEALTRFHSSWHYSAIRLLTSIDGYSKIPQIAERLRLEPAIVQNALEFLVESGLCLKDGDKFKMGPKRTHLPIESPLIANRHVAWRLKSFERVNSRTDEDLFLTTVMVLSAKAKAKILQSLRETIATASETAVHSKSEVLACLNIDLFEI